MSGRFFLDTNIFVYSFDASAPKKAAQATKLIRRGINTRGGIVSYQVVQEFFNVALRRFAKPMSSPDAEQYLSTTFRPLLAVHSSPGVDETWSTNTVLRLGCSWASQSGATQH